MKVKVSGVCHLGGRGVQCPPPGRKPPILLRSSVHWGSLSRSQPPTTNINHTPCQMSNLLQRFLHMIGFRIVGKGTNSTPSSFGAIKDKTKRSLSSFVFSLASLLGKDIKLVIYSGCSFRLTLYSIYSIVYSIVYAHGGLETLRQNKKEQFSCKFLMLTFSEI